MTKSAKATCFGFVAILLWSSIIGLIKEVTTAFGAIGGSALMYSLAFLFLLLSGAWVPFKKFPKKYLLIGGLLMIFYEFCLSLSIGYSQNSRQAIEIGMVNYLWPTFTMVGTIIFHTKKTNWFIVPGVLLSMLGIVWVLGGDEGLDLQQMLNNVRQNPLSYGLAFIGAMLWSGYCVATLKFAQGINGVMLFFMLVALVLWGKYFFLDDAPVMHFTIPSVIYLLITAAIMGFSYAAWNIGIMGGNVTLLTVASYFIPVFSSALSSVLLATVLGLSFWQGALMVCVGAVLCWISTIQRKPKGPNAIHQKIALK